MSGFGSPNPFPRRFGGSRRPQTLERAALARVFAKEEWDISDETTKAAEAYAFGRAIGSIWSINRRLAGAEVPATMVETLPTYEEIHRTRPSPEDTDNARRSYVEAKMRAIAGQATSTDIEDVCIVLLGSRFEGLATVDPADEFSYWPGVNPGPPGFEWTSNRCVLGIRVRQGTTGRAAWERLLSQLYQTLSTLVPAYIVFEIGQNDGGFLVGEGPGSGVVGLTFVGGP